ncbi:MAG: epoxyqueuosine reductase QueH [Clostridia bacterium]|nr:epoxyqueuosine reductase QueH [Clostridia bacterium]
MNRTNFNAEMEKIIAANKKAGIKPKLLLHSCCAPCSSACIERVKDFFDVTVYYYNPNIDGIDEYNKRAKESERLCAEMGINCIIENYSPEEYYSAVKGFENEPEGGARCERCFYLRLKRAAVKAKEENFGYFTTTLTVSPLKNAELLNAIGNKVADETGVKFLPSDFKKKGGYLRSIELSKEYSLYRQNYCGCVFSKGKNPTCETL